MVVVFGETVNVPPVPICAPPQEPVYQYCVPNAPRAVNVTLWPEQIVLLEAEIPVGAGVVPAQFVER